MAPTSGSQYTASRNSFHLLRFVLAALVILGQSHVLLGRTGPLESLSGSLMSEGSLAVDGFMVVSGFLICQSTVHSRNAFTFLGKRLLRILPGLLGALLFSAMIVGALVYDGSVVRYVQLGEGGPLTWMLRQLALGLLPEQQSVTGVFASNPSSVLNAGLWTLRYLLAFWALMALLRLTTLARRRPTYIVAFTVFLILHVLQSCFGVQLWTIADRRWWLLSREHYASLARLGLFFFSGTLLYAYRRELPRKWYMAVFALLALGGLCLFRHIPAQVDAASGSATHALWQLAMLPLRLVYVAALPYLIVYAGGSPHGSGMMRLGDLSLGLYALSCPIGQMIIHCAPSIAPWPLFALTLAITLPLALFSWRMLELPAIRLKGSR